MDIVMGLCHSLVRNYINNVCRGKALEPPILLQGGVSANRGIVRAFEEILGHEVIIPEHHMVMGAFGAALIAADAGIETSCFGGFAVAHQEISTKGFTCTDCDNRCEVIELIKSKEIIGRSGGRCRKWEGSKEKRAAGQKIFAYMRLRSAPE